jgi:hypothetical protein
VEALVAHLCKAYRALKNQQRINQETTEKKHSLYLLILVLHRSFLQNLFLRTYLEESVRDGRIGASAFLAQRTLGNVLIAIPGMLARARRGGGAAGQ